MYLLIGIIGDGFDARFSTVVKMDIFDKIEAESLQLSDESAIQFVNSKFEDDEAFNRVLMLRTSVPKYMPANIGMMLDPVATLLQSKTKVVLNLGVKYDIKVDLLVWMHKR
jgi:hypothetical protein